MMGDGTKDKGTRGHGDREQGGGDEGTGDKDMGDRDKGTGTVMKTKVRAQGQGTGKDQGTGGGQNRQRGGREKGTKGQGRGQGPAEKGRREERWGETVTSCPGGATWLRGDIADGTEGTSLMAGDRPQRVLASGTSATLPRGGG